MRVRFSMLHASGHEGAATVVLELAEELIAQGHEVDLCAWWMANPMASHCAAAGVHRREDIRSTDPFDYGLAIFLHYSARLQFFRPTPGAKRRTSIFFFRLSHSSNIRVPSAILEEMIADPWFANSDEAKTRLVRDYALLAEKIEVLRNAAPSRFRNQDVRAASPVRRVIYVSNHGNSEVTEAPRILRSSFRVGTINYGAGGERQAPVTPKQITDEGAVVTMAKTTQLATLAKRLLCVYDYSWGRPGYLNAENFARVSDNNLSGSYQPRPLTHNAIPAEIMEG